MADLDRLYDALRKADAAGNADDAKTLASAIRNLRDSKTLDYDKLTYAPTVGMGSGERAAAGAGRSVYEAGRGLGQLTGLVSAQDEKDARALDRPLMSTPAGQVGNTLGNVGMTLLPGGALKGAGTALRAAGEVGAADLASTAGGVMLAPNTIRSGLAVGTGVGLIQPATDLKERAMNVGLGAGGGATVPVLNRGAATAKAFLEPLYEGGQNNIVGRTIQRAAGGENVVPQLRSATELVPGSQPTVGQASGNAGVAALERTASATNPEVTNAFSQRMLAQNDARVKALQSVAGDSTDLEMFKNAREQTAGKLYQQAFKAGVDEKKLTPKVQEYIGTLMENPYVQDALPTARKMAQADRVNFDDPNGSVAGMHYIKMALDAQMQNKAMSGLSGTQVAQIAKVQDQLVGVLQKLSPKYAQAMSEYEAASKPINQLQIGDKVFRNSTSAQLDQLGNPTVYPEKMAAQLKNSDKVAADATGFKRAKMENILEPDQMSTLQNVAADLSRAQTARNAGRGSGSDTVQKMAYSSMMEQAGIPTWLKALIPSQIVGNLSARAGDLVYTQANKDLSRKLAETMLDPKEAAKLIENLAPGDKMRLTKMLLRGMTPVGMSAPALINGQK